MVATAHMPLFSSSIIRHKAIHASSAAGKVKVGCVTLSYLVLWTTQGGPKIGTCLYAL